MTRQEKHEQVAELAEQLRSNPNFYILDIMGMSVAKNNDLRRAFHQKGYRLEMVKNTLIQKALESTDGDHSAIFPALKQSSTIVFIKELGNEPARLLKEFRGEGGLPLLKGAYIDGAAFVGDDQLDTLVNLKSKNDLIGELIGLLQSPARNVISALQSGGTTIAGVVKTLQERPE